MTTGEFYYLLMVCGTFVVFSLVLAHSCWQYRRWLTDQPAPAPQVEHLPAPEVERLAA